MTTYEINIAFRGEHWGLVKLPTGVDLKTARIRYDMIRAGVSFEGFEITLFSVSPATRKDISTNGTTSF